MSNSKKGFTLIELLVVIAIIGILSGIVLTSLGAARSKAKIASAQASTSSMRSQAELGSDTSGNYVGNLCSSVATGGLGTLWNAVNTQIGSGNTRCGYSGDTAVTSANWVFATNFEAVSAGANYYCADSTGFAGPITATNYGFVNGNSSGGQNVATGNVDCSF